MNIGDVLVVRSNGAAGFLIRLGAALRNKPNLGNHIAVMHHTDDKGIPWGLEGKPGGVGWVDLRNYSNSRWTMCNDGQPISTAQAASVARAMGVMVGTPYDWQAIAADAFKALHIEYLFAQDWHGKGIPGHVVCSSLAAWAYEQAGLAHPGESGHERFVAPGDWNQFILTKAWE